MGRGSLLREKSVNSCNRSLPHNLSQDHHPRLGVARRNLNSSPFLFHVASAPGEISRISIEHSASL
jgi:hypothetical protein